MYYLSENFGRHFNVTPRKTDRLEGESRIDRVWAARKDAVSDNSVKIVVPADNYGTATGR